MRVLRLLRQPAPLAVWLGQLFSVTGDKLYAMALLWLVLQLTGSAKLMATVSVAESVPYVLVGFLGAGLIARSRRLRAMIWLDFASAAVIALIPLSFLLGIRFSESRSSGLQRWVSLPWPRRSTHCQRHPSSRWRGHGCSS
jgi:hypothetical protein